MDQIPANACLLLLDDDRNILKSLQRLLSKDGYVIHCFTSPAEALEFLRHNAVGVIVCDQHMPEMSGAAFLHAASVFQARSIRIALTGHNEQDTITQAVNQGSPWRIVTKPWENDALREIVAEAFRIYTRGPST